jgi:hypothetical protein
MLSAAARMRRRVRSSGGTEPAVHRAVFGDVDVFARGDGDGRGEELAEVGEDPAQVFPDLQKLFAEFRALEDACGCATLATPGSFEA